MSPSAKVDVAGNTSPEGGAKLYERFDDKAVGLIKLFGDKLDQFVDDKQLETVELIPGTTLFPTYLDDLSATYRFEKKPKNAAELACLLNRKYALGDGMELDLQAHIEELVKIGLDVETEYEFLINALNSVIADGTIDVDDAAAAKLDESETKTETSWGTAGLIAALGVGFSTVMSAIKNRDKDSSKNLKKNHDQLAQIEV